MEHYDAADLPALEQISVQVASGGTPLREDAGIMFAQQLNYVRTANYERRTPAMRIFDIVPISTEVPEYAETIEQKSYDIVGVAKVISNYAHDLPRADVVASSRLVKVKDIGDSFGYSVRELQASNATGAQLDVRKGAAARKAIDVKTAQIAAIGEPVYGLFGLLNHPSIGTTVGLTGGWATATGDVMLSDLNKFVATIAGQSKNNFQTTRVAMADTDLNLMGSKYLANSGGKTVAQAFREQHPEITLVGLVEFRGAGTAGGNLMVASEFSPENYAFDLVQPFNQQPAQARNLEVVINCLARVGGVNVFYPEALTKGTLAL